VRLVRLARSATRGDHLVSGGDKAGNEEGADVAGGADDDDSDRRVAGVAMKSTAGARVG
jgi:hypothetical protein